MITPIVFAPGDYVSPDEVGYAWSFAVGIGYLGLGYAAFIIALLLKARSLSKAQTHEEDEMRELAARPLCGGPRRVVRGRVELDEGKDVAIEIDIEQVVTDHKSRNGTWHTWDESARTTRKAPFYLVREDGETVYVDPPDDVFVIDELETKYPIDAPRARVRIADVRRGETFFVCGELHRGPHPRSQSTYRDGAGWILRSPRRRMLLATDAIHHRHQERISFLNLVGSLLAVSFIVVHVCLTASFLDAAVFGEHTTGQVTYGETWVTSNKGHRTTRYSLTVKTPDGLVLTREVPRKLFEATWPLRPGEDAASIPVLETGQSTSSSYFGFEPGLLRLGLFVAVFGSLVAAASTLAGYRRRAAWYDRAKLNERGGSGAWNEPRPQKPVLKDER